MKFLLRKGVFVILFFVLTLINSCGPSKTFTYKILNYPHESTIPDNDILPIDGLWADKQGNSLRVSKGKIYYVKYRILRSGPYRSTRYDIPSGSAIVKNITPIEPCIFKCEFAYPEPTNEREKLAVFEAGVLAAGGTRLMIYDISKRSIVLNKIRIDDEQSYNLQREKRKRNLIKEEEFAWETAEKNNSISSYETYVSKYPKSKRVNSAKEKINDLIIKTSIKNIDVQITTQEQPFFNHVLFPIHIDLKGQNIDENGLEEIILSERLMPPRSPKAEHSFIICTLDIDPTEDFTADIELDLLKPNSGHRWLSIKDQLNHFRRITLVKNGNILVSRPKNNSKQDQFAWGSTRNKGDTTIKAKKRRDMKFKFMWSVKNDILNKVNICIGNIKYPLIDFIDSDR